MKIAVVGAGAMGSLFGALLADAGNVVWLYDIWSEHVRAINEKGLKVDREGKTLTVKIKATENPKEIKTVELVIIFVKSTQTRSAAETARSLIDPKGVVMTLQNGMGNTDIIAEFVPPVQILAGTTSHGATLLGPGHIRHAGPGSTTIGAWADSKQGLEQAQKYSKFFNKAGIVTEAVEDVRRIVWNKLLINVGINAITALTAIKNGQILDLEVTKALSRAAVIEAIKVARAKDVDVLENAVDQVFKIAEATAANRSSMGQDVDNKRQTEISAINGYISNEANIIGIDAPVNQTLTALVETLQYHY